VKEHPILFSGPMVRAILAGTKSVTRRVVKHGAQPVPPDRSVITDTYPNGQPGWFALWPHTYGARRALACPYGAAGDRLWVRETWAGDDACGFVYRADHPHADLARCDLDDGEQTIRRWHPAIHMRRAASRLTLDVLSVRVERLQDISEEDARAEGVEPLTEYADRAHRRAFAALWDQINGKRAPGLSNPWVWRVEFRGLP
jgi:hypothetical protein